MPFTSRKSRNATSSISRANNPASSRLNAFARFRSGFPDGKPKLPRTSNPFDTLAEERTARKEAELTSNHDSKQLDDLTEEIESFAINALSDDSHVKRQTTGKSLETIREQRTQDVIASEKGWVQSSKKHKREGSNTTRESRLVVQAARTGVHSPHWRSGNGATNSSTWHDPRGPGTGTHRTGRGTHRGVGKMFYGIPLSELVVGAIIFHKETRECYDEKAEGDVFKSNDGQLHFRKGRFSVIEAVHAFTLVKSPMFTYRGKGIEKKNEEVKKEHVGVRPLHIPSGQYIQQNKYAPLEVELMNDEFEQLHEKTVLRFTERSTITFDTKVRVVGRLTAESIARLKSLRAKFGC